MRFFYDGDLWASATLFSLRIDVQNNSDANAVGTAVAQLTAPGVDDAFYNEVLALTGGSGLMNFDIADFFPVNATGLFTSTGTITFPAASVPETHSTVMALLLAGVSLLLARQIPARLPRLKLAFRSQKMAGLSRWEQRSCSTKHAKTLVHEAGFLVHNA